MKLMIDQQPVTANNVSYNDGLGYGRLDKDNIEVHSYTFFIDRNDIVEKLRATYWKCLEEIRLDDEKCLDTSPFKEIGYVPLNEAFEYPEKLAEVIGTYFDREIFELYISYKTEAKFIINSTDKIHITADGVQIEGRCFENHQPSNYRFETDAV